LQRLGITPNAFALGTLLQVTSPDHDRLHVSLTPGTANLIAIGDLGSSRTCAAVRAELCSNNHAPEARRTSHRGQKRAAVFATSGFACGGGATSMTMECFCGHRRHPCCAAPQSEQNRALFGIT
jgi:hypothetical protein